MISPSIHRAEVEDYIDGVLSGRIPAGKLCRLAVERHVLDLEIGGDRGLYHDEDAANNHINFFPHLSHTTGEFHGLPFHLRQFQKFIVWVLLGWKRADGYRRFRDAFISVARGNGKSPLGAGLLNDLTFCDCPLEHGAEGYSVATKEKQARIVFEESQRQIEYGELKPIVELYRTSSFLPAYLCRTQPIGSDSKTTDGLIIHALIRDELHEWQESHRGLYSKLVTAMGKRRQPLAATITTAGDDRSEIWIEQRDYSVSVVEQVITKPDKWFGDDHFSFICEVDKEDDIYDEDNWPKANPMLLEPQSPVKIDHLRSMADKARAGNKMTEYEFRRYHCNQQVTSLSKPLPVELWNKGSGEVNIDKMTICFAAFDLGRSDDFCAVVLVWRVGEEYHIRTWVWTTKERGEELRTAEFQSLLDSPNVTVHEGNQVEWIDVRRKVVELNKQYNIKGWYYDDSWAHETGQILQDEHGINIQGFPQSYRMYNEPIKRFIEELGKGNVRHGNDRVLGWQAGNLVIETNSELLSKPSKKHSKYKIDSIVALFMAFSGMMLQKPPPSGNFYERYNVDGTKREQAEI